MEPKEIAERATHLMFAGRFDEARDLADPDLEVVGRNGSVRGEAAFEYIREWWKPQREAFDIEHVIERTIDAGEGTFVVLSQVRRVPKEGTGYVKAWPANVIRVRDGRVVFAEGYADRRDALRAVGVADA